MTDRELKISTAPTRYALHWTNELTTWAQFAQRLGRPYKGQETSAEYRSMTHTQRDNAKDHGGFVGGHLAQGLRRKGHVLERSILTLDVDHPAKGFTDRLKTALPYAWVLYSTHSHTADRPRYRLVVPLLRDATPEEYPAIARRIAQDLGIDQFDETTYRPQQLMYWQSHPIDVEPVFISNTGEWLDPDEQLARYTDWTDLSTWPTSSRETNQLTRSVEKQADPLKKPGLVGAFCRAHTIEQAIETYLTDVYMPAQNGRYTYTKGESTNGLIIYDHKFAYSHHATDPAGDGHVHNAFDIVRIHLFGSYDDDVKPKTPTAKRPSFTAMTALATEDKDVKETLNRELLESFSPLPTDGEVEKKQDDTDSSSGDATADTSAAPDWMSGLERKKNGTLAETLENLTLITTNDPELQAIRYNRFSYTITVDDPTQLPWTQQKPGWTDADNAQLKLYIERKYHLYAPAKTLEALTIGANTRSYHPIIDELETLPPWDGTHRIRTLLCDTLGAADTEFTRQATTITLVAAIARLYNPGIKFDYVLTLVGAQGIGKSTLFSKLAGRFFSDDLSISDMSGKAAAEKLQGAWILELSEMTGMRKTDVEVVKAFISRTEDRYRPAYGRNVETFPRQCILVATTNAMEGFLRDVTGGRRFLPIITKEVGRIPAWELTPEYIDQIWAEALALYRTGTELVLTGEAAVQAAWAQRDALEADDRTGLVETFLSIPLPEGWESWTTRDRRAWLGTGGAPEAAFGGAIAGSEPNTHKRRVVTNLEIWCECFGQDVADFRPQRDGREIALIMEQIRGWRRGETQEREHVFPYGRQRVYLREILPQEGEKS